MYTIHTFARVVEELLGALGVSRTHVLAHDVGDTVAQELLARHSARQAAAGLTGAAQGVTRCMRLVAAACCTILCR
jgi:pimeloyl-ACP methyl ester carboxylesterase